MAVLHFFFMYIFMYFMVDKFSNIFPNLNQIYMAAIMTMPMIFLELFLMKGMYSDRRLNFVLIAIAILFLIVLFIFIRQQTGISNIQFLKSMIPHHAGAILMCEKASLSDPQIIELCENITKNQQYEIEWMKSKINEVQK